MESTSNEREGVHLHTLVDRERKRSSERVDGVVLVVIQITDDRVPNGRHLPLLEKGLLMAHLIWPLMAH